jgi:competence ComEA-like helix-hairpin-helix protein
MKGGPSSGKACLVLSLIVLVWNVGATARLLLPEDPALASEAGETMPAPEPTDAQLTAKQAFLLGKRVDINRAGLAEIEGLPGISRAVAESVVETRKRLGGFRRPDDLLKVTGIKEKRLKKILPFLVEFHNN